MKLDNYNSSVSILSVALPDSWFMYGSHKLKIFPEKRTWESARTYCQSIGGDLVSISSEDKNEFITHLLGHYITNVTAG